MRQAYNELVEIASDLPNGPTLASAAAVPGGPASSWPRRAGDQRRSSPSGSAPATGCGSQRQEVNAVLGNVTLDYTEAQIPYQEIFIDVKSILADVKIRIPQNAIVHLDSNPILGSVSEQDSGRGSIDQEHSRRPRSSTSAAPPSSAKSRSNEAPRLQQTPRPDLSEDAEGLINQGHPAAVGGSGHLDCYSIAAMTWGTVELEAEVRTWLESLPTADFAKGSDW